MNRRNFAKTVASAGVPLGLAGCTSDSGDGSDGNDNGGTLGTDESVVATIGYESQGVTFTYTYIEDNVDGESTAPQSVVFHTRESPDSGEIIYEVSDTKQDVGEAFSFEDLGADTRDELPQSAVTVTYEDGSSEVLTRESIDGTGPFIGEQISIEKDLETGETVITASQFNAEYISIREGGTTEYARIEDQGGSVTIPVEDSYSGQDGDELFNSNVYELVAVSGETETRLQLFTAGFPEPDYSSRNTYVEDRYVVEFSLDNYDEVEISGLEVAIGTDDPEAELTEQENVRVTEPTSMVGTNSPTIITVETENGYEVDFSVDYVR